MQAPQGSLGGRLITFEGIDFSGKSLQAKLLSEKLCSVGCSVLQLRDPGATPISERIRSILLDKAHLEMSPWTELLLYEAARAQMVEQTIKPALKKGEWVICDRLYDSSTAYQGYGRQLDLGLVEQANIIGACGVVPDLTFLIDLDVRVALQRRQKSKRNVDRLESEGIQFQERVRQGYLETAKEELDRIHVIAGDRSVDRIHEEIWQIVNKRFQRELHS